MGAQPLALTKFPSTMVSTFRSSEVVERNVKALVSMALFDMSTNFQLELSKFANTEAPAPLYFPATEEDLVKGVSRKPRSLLLVN